MLSMYIPNLEKLQSLTDVNLSHNELTRSKYVYEIHEIFIINI